MKRYEKLPKIDLGVVPNGVKVQVLSSAPSLFKCLFQALLQATFSIVTKL